MLIAVRIIVRFTVRVSISSCSSRMVQLSTLGRPRERCIHRVAAPISVHDLPPGVRWPMTAASLTSALAARFGCGGWRCRLRKRCMPRPLVISKSPTAAKPRNYSNTQGVATLGRRHKGWVTWGQRSAPPTLLACKWLTIGNLVSAATPPFFAGGTYPP